MRRPPVVVLNGSANRSLSSRPRFGSRRTSFAAYPRVFACAPRHRRKHGCASPCLTTRSRCNRTASRSREIRRHRRPSGRDRTFIAFTRPFVGWRSCGRRRRRLRDAESRLARGAFRQAVQYDAYVHCSSSVFYFPLLSGSSGTRSAYLAGHLHEYPAGRTAGWE